MHPYTRGLIESIPEPGSTPHRRLRTIEGTAADLRLLGAGCRFARALSHACGSLRGRRAPAHSGGDGANFSLLASRRGAVVSDVLSPADPSAGYATQHERAHTLIATESVSKYFPVHPSVLGAASRFIRAVEGVSLRVRYGETVAVVGESGVRQEHARPRDAAPHRPDVRPSRLRRARHHADSAARTACRFGGGCKIVFQDPYSSLNPRMTVREIVGEAIRIHKLAEDAPRRESRVVELLKRSVCAPTPQISTRTSSRGASASASASRGLSPSSRIHRMR